MIAVTIRDLVGGWVYMNALNQLKPTQGVMRASEELSDICAADAPNSLRQAKDADGIRRLQIIVLQKLTTNAIERFNCIIRSNY